MTDDNPYETLDLDPCADLETLTEALRERAEDLEPEERGDIQSIWQTLTMRRDVRLQHALLARPRAQSQAPLRILARGLPTTQATEGPPGPEALREALGVSDLLLLPPPTAFAPSRADEWSVPRLSEDPFFTPDE